MWSDILYAKECLVYTQHVLNPIHAGWVSIYSVAWPWRCSEWLRWNCVWLVRFKSWNHPTTVPQWLVVWNIFLFFHILGISSSQLTHIFQRGRYTTNQPMSCYYGAFQPCRWEELRNLILQRPLVTLHETRNFTKINKAYDPFIGTTNLIVSTVISNSIHEHPQTLFL